ncbi:MAG: type II toxin-antitoxin system RelE/ParE family toxin [Cyclobacteriaceae bacterium]
MGYSLSYFEDAKKDMKDAKAWYKDRSAGLDKRFAQSIKAAILKLQVYPLAYSIRFKNIRIAYPKIFPYGIHFYVDEYNSKIVIVAIVHNKRNPDLVRSRLTQ